MVNRLTSNVDESLVNLNTVAQKAQRERDEKLQELDQIFIDLRTHLEHRYRQYATKIKSSYDYYDQHLHRLKCQLEHIREELINNFTSVESDENEENLFNMEKYRCLEMLTSQTINQTINEQTVKPNYRIELTDIEHMDHCYVVQSDGEYPLISSTCDENRLSKDPYPKQRSQSVGEVSFCPDKVSCTDVCFRSIIDTSTSTNGTDEYDNVPTENYGHYHVSYHQSLKAPLRMLERWSCSLESGNYFIPLLIPYRQSSLIMYCLDRESFFCYNARASTSLLASNTMIKWRGTRPSSVYWFDQMNMLFIACSTYIYGCYLE